MFIDEVVITVKAGNGGDGVISFRREKFIARGGPDGGHGGTGGSVYLIADENMDTLQDFVHNRLFRSENGKAGSGANRTGKSGDDLYLKVPLGTMVFQQMLQQNSPGEDQIIALSPHTFLCDLDKHGDKFLCAKGGRGGKGNVSFAHSLNQTPRLAEMGEKGEEKTLYLELKVLADIGLVGFPNAGKSTLLGKISRTDPKIGAYPFTTLRPQLGKHFIPFKKPFTVADIPGIIEGASQGKGLGIRFLKHIERCRMLMFMVDLDQDIAHAKKQLETLFQEVCFYNEHLKEKSWIICGNKIDTIQGKENQNLMEEYFKMLALPYFFISGKESINIDSLMNYISESLDHIPSLPSETRSFTLYTLEDKAIRIEQLAEKLYRVHCQDLERIVAASDLHHPGSLRYISRMFKKLQLEKILSKHGVNEGDSVEIAGKRMIWT
ncbi:MAG TPA: GTPase ObgE [Caldisericia bacterium]|nr:GTPase ObgE [Caldisericia bacterium]